MKIPRKANLKYYPYLVEKILFENTQIGKFKKRSKRIGSHQAAQITHHKALETISKDPPIIGVYEKVVPEMELETQKNGEYGEIDLILKGEKITYLIEYKGTNRNGNKKDAKKQLLRAKKHLPEKFQNNITKLLYVHEEFITEELQKNNWIPFNYTPAK